MLLLLSSESAASSADDDDRSGDEAEDNAQTDPRCLTLVVGEDSAAEKEATGLHIMQHSSSNSTAAPNDTRETLNRCEAMVYVDAYVNMHHNSFRSGGILFMVATVYRHRLITWRAFESQERYGKVDVMTCHGRRFYDCFDHRVTRRVSHKLPTGSFLGSFTKISVEG